MSGGLPFIAGIGMSVHTWEGLSFPSCTLLGLTCLTSRSGLFPSLAHDSVQGRHSPPCQPLCPALQLRHTSGGPSRAQALSHTAWCTGRGRGASLPSPCPQPFAGHLKLNLKFSSKVP